MFAKMQTNLNLKEDKYTHPIIALYLITISMTDAFGFHPWIPLPVAVISLGVFVIFAKFIYFRRFVPPPLVDLDYWIFCLLFLMTIASFLNAGEFGKKQFNHLLSYGSVVILFYYVVRVFLENFSNNNNQIKQYIAIGVLLSSVAAIAEFILKNTVSIDIDIYMNRISSFEYNPLYMREYIRARSFTAESGHFALYLEIFAPIALVFIWSNYTKIFSYTFTFVILLAFISTLSAAGLAAAIFSFFVVTALYTALEKNLERKIQLILILALLSLGVVLAYDIIRDFVGPILDKITLSAASDRIERWKTVLEIIQKNSFFGVGPGGFLSSLLGSGVVSWWLQIIVEVGVLGFIFIIMFWYLIFVNSFKVGTIYKYAYIASFSAAIVHYFVISNYWYPWYWTLLAICEWEGRGRNIK